jgi:DIM1 family U5 snRNP protein
MDEVLYSIAEDVKNYCVIYLVDIKEVPDFNSLYELYDPVTVMFFYRWIFVIADLL